MKLPSLADLLDGNLETTARFINLHTEHVNDRSYVLSFYIVVAYRVSVQAM